MRVIEADEALRLLDMGALIEALRAGFAGHVVQPVRHHHSIERPDGPASTLLLMPAWSDMVAAGTSRNGYAGIKIVTVAPGNASLGKPSVVGVYILASGETGEVLAIIDGPAITVRRTAAASALAASYLARPAARRHLIVGAGAMAPALAEAMRCVRPIEETLIWARSPDKAEALAADLAAQGMTVSPVADLKAALSGADIVSAATLSREPLVRGDWLAPGTHVDLVGAFTAGMRESDDAAVARSTVFVDTRGGALSEGGDLVQAIASGAFAADRVAADLHELSRAEHLGRRDEAEITLFKSVGAALEDLAAAVLVYEASGREA